MTKSVYFLITLLFLTIAPIISAQNVQSDNNFEITGQVTSISENTFKVADETITMEPSRVEEFKQKGVLNAGETAKVKGIISSDSTKLAQEIIVLQKKAEVKTKSPVDQVNTLLQNLLNSLKGVVG